MDHGQVPHVFMLPIPVTALPTPETLYICYYTNGIVEMLDVFHRFIDLLLLRQGNVFSSPKNPSLRAKRCCEVLPQPGKYTVSILLGKNWSGLLG